VGEDAEDEQRGQDDQAKRWKAALSAETWPRKASATRPPETVRGNSVARTPLSKIVDERAVWSVECSVVIAKAGRKARARRR
jgi:hypothetical protein